MNEGCKSALKARGIKAENERTRRRKGE
jgi:hypothetical protein